MIADPFTDAAMKHLAKVDRDKSREWFDGFVACTRWARTHLAAQEPTDAEVEAAAEAWSKSFIDGHPQREAWKPGGDISTRYAAIERARTALSAARAARRDEKDTP